MKSWIRSSRQILNHNNGDNQPDSLSSTDRVTNSSGIAKETKKKTNFPTPPKPQSLNYMRSENSFLFTNYIIIVSLAVAVAAAVSSTFNRVLPSLLSLSSTTEILLSTPTPFAQFEVVAWRSFNLIHHNITNATVFWSIFLLHCHRDFCLTRHYGIGSKSIAVSQIVNNAGSVQRRNETAEKNGIEESSVCAVTCNKSISRY